MFKKFVSNLPFSPSLIHQFGFYFKRLKKEEVTRRIGLFFLILTIIAQSLTVMQPAESANASNGGDFITGGIVGNDVSGLLSIYDKNTQNFKDIMNYAGITRQDLSKTDYKSFRTGQRIIWGSLPRYSYEDGERTHNIYSPSGGLIKKIYSRPLSLSGGPNREFIGWVGKASFGWFAIRQSCGNLVTDIIPPIQAPKPEPEPEPTPDVKPQIDTQLNPAPEAQQKINPKPEVTEKEEICRLNPSIKNDDKRCKACPGNETIWLEDESCKPDIIKSKKSINLSQGSVDATSTVAKAGDRISYTINIKNKGFIFQDSVIIEDYLADVLEYALLVDNGGGILDKDSKVLSWPSVILMPGAIQTRVYTVMIMDDIPTTAIGQSDDTSYDCVITNTFGNSINIFVDCPIIKTAEQVVINLPVAGPKDNILFLSLLLGIVVFFYARSKQQNKEIRLIKRNFSDGLI